MKKYIPIVPTESENNLALKSFIPKADTTSLTAITNAVAIIFTVRPRCLKPIG